VQDKRDLLLNALREYKTSYQEEKSIIPELISFINNNVDCFENSNIQAQITGAAWVLSPDNKKVLLTHHKKFNRWIQFGGHSEGDSNTWNVALREAQEESGINELEFVTRDIFDIDMYIIPPKLIRNKPEHKMYDIRFLLRAKNENFLVNNESNTLKWFTLREVKEDVCKDSPELLRMVNKWQKFIPNLSIENKPIFKNHMWK